MNAEEQSKQSAVHVPEHAPPIQEPVPASPANRPEPVALLPAALTVTVMAPVVPTLPLTVKFESPALDSVPFVIRTG